MNELLIKLQDTIGYVFRDENLLKKALTHTSYLNEHHLGKTESNERLEFLGDAILEQVSSEYLYLTFPNALEGDLSKIRSSVVCEKGLAESAREINLGASLFLGKGTELEGGRERDSLISDAFEALIAAIYLDGGMIEAKKFIEKYVLTHVHGIVEFTDYKTELQELVQNEETHIEYTLLKEEGPDHDKRFEVSVSLNGQVVGIGTGHSKKQAQQMAAEKAIKQLKENY